MEFIVDSSAFVRVKGDWFRIDSGMRQECFMFHWVFNVYMDGVMKDVNRGWEGGE